MQAQLQYAGEDLNPVLEFLDDLAGIESTFAYGLMRECASISEGRHVHLRYPDGYCLLNCKTDELRRRMQKENVTGGLPALHLLNALLFGQLDNRQASLLTFFLLVITPPETLACHCFLPCFFVQYSLLPVCRHFRQ